MHCDALFADVYLHPCIMLCGLCQCCLSWTHVLVLRAHVLKAWLIVEQLHKCQQFSHVTSKQGQSAQ